MTDAVPIVDAAGALVGNLSAADLRGLGSFRDAALAAATGACASAPASPGGRHPDDRRLPRREVVAVPPTAPLRDIIDAAVRNKVSRVYVVDDERRPVGCVTHADILRVIAAAGRRGSPPQQGSTVTTGSSASPQG
eukprot:gene37718-66241_t